MLVQENVLEIKEDQFFLETLLISSEQPEILKFPSNIEILKCTSDQRKTLNPVQNSLQLLPKEQLHLTLKLPVKTIKLLNAHIASVPSLQGEKIKFKKPKKLLVASPPLQYGKTLTYDSKEGIYHLEWGEPPQYSLNLPVRLKAKGKALVSELKLSIPLPPDYYQKVSSIRVNTGKITVKKENDMRVGEVKIKRFSGGTFGVIQTTLTIIPSGITLPSRNWGQIYEIPETKKRRLCRNDELWPTTHPEILRLAQELRRDEIYSTVKAIFNFIRKNIEVKGYSKRRLGAKETLKRKRASYADLTDLFITICRSAAIPARRIVGLHFTGKPRSPEHVWADIFSPKLGWIPMDPAFGLFGTQGIQHISLSIEERSNVDLDIQYKWKAYGLPRLQIRPEKPIITNIR